MRIRPASLLLAALGAAGLAGCGSTTVRHVTTTITRPAPTGTGSAPSPAGASSATTSPPSTTVPSSTTSTTSTAGAARTAGSAVSGRAPRAIIAAAADALRRAGTYAMRADLVQDHARTQIALTTTGPRTFDATLSTGSSSFAVISVSDRAYLRGDDAFWRAHAGTGTAARARAARLAGHWLQVPATGSHSVTKSLGTLSPATLGRCLTEDHGTLTIAGHATVDGVAAVVVRDAGNAPGSTPSTIAVAARGTPYPLRYVATGATRSGGRVDVCNDGKGDGATGTITLDQFGSVPAIHPPSGVQSDPGAPLT